MSSGAYGTIGPEREPPVKYYSRKMPFEFDEAESKESLPLKGIIKLDEHIDTEKIGKAVNIYYLYYIYK